MSPTCTGAAKLEPKECPKHVSRSNHCRHHEHSHDVYDKHRHFVPKAERKLSAVCRYSDSCSAVTVATAAGEIQRYVVAGGVRAALACSPAACITQGRQLAAVRSEVSNAVVTCSNPCSTPFALFSPAKLKLASKLGYSILGSRQPVILLCQDMCVVLIDKSCRHPG